MCTVTFLPLSDHSFVLTSSRDVGYKREKASFPASYIEKGVPLCYPRDGKAGGTWIGTSRNNRLICLLNGGFRNHSRKDDYPKSRGLIVKELLIAENFEAACNTIELDLIEPFTLVVVSWEKGLGLFEFVWDGDHRHFRQMDLKPAIWSSSTLYNDRMKEMRERWFGHWLNEGEISSESILGFHKNAGTGDPETDVFMKRERVGTVSITQVVKNENQVDMLYEPF